MSRAEPAAGGRRAPLAGIRVFDLTRVLAGPFCTMALADLGADVIKVEGPNTPDYTRSIPPLTGGMSHYFLAVNRNKRAVSIDLKSERGQALALDLALRCDVVVENFRPGVLARLGLGYEALRARRPDIIVCSLSGFGQDGPMAGRPSVDTVVQALSGAMSVNGEPDLEPLKLGLPMGDLAGAMWGAIGILAALHDRDATGAGTHLDVSLLDSMISHLAYLAELYLTTGESPPRVGSNHQTVPAYGSYAVADGTLVLAAQMDSFWANFCTAAGRSELAADPRFRAVADRQRHYAEVEEIVSEIMLTRDRADWIRLLEAADVPHAAILSVGEALDQPHVRGRGLIREVDQPGAGRLRVVGPVLKFLTDPAPGELGPAPLFGQHTREVLASVLGLSDNEIQRLVEEGAVGAASPT
ncbi:MAG: CaiB/BaiF CoA transferase family protein [Candidatus Dormibacteraceae bacterium]